MSFVVSPRAEDDPLGDNLRAALAELQRRYPLGSAWNHIPTQKLYLVTGFRKAKIPQLPNDPLLIDYARIGQPELRFTTTEERWVQRFEREVLRG